VAQNLVTKI